MLNDQRFPMDIRQGIRRQILENFLFTDDPAALADDESFLERGFIDSTGVIEIAHFLEDTFGIEVEGAEMLPENLDSIDNLVAFVERKRATRAQGNPAGS
jgi:acyl carrier protein